MSGNGHSKLAPSSAFRWTDCTASVAFLEANAAILPDDTSKYNVEGERAHLVLTKRLTGQPDFPADNDEMDGIINRLIEYIREIYQEGDLLLVDQKVRLFYLPSSTGTLDIALVGKRRIVILDLKYGVGVSVDAEENPQLGIYGESKIQELEAVIGRYEQDFPVHLIIYQPRDRNNPEVVREWSTTRIELNRFCQPIQQAADLILSGGPTAFNPGDACQFCRAAGICEAKAIQGLSPLSSLDGEPVDSIMTDAMSCVPAPNAITREQRQRVLLAKKDLISWLEAVENQEVAELLAGAPPMDFKLVEGKTNRQWKDEKATARLLLTRLEHNQIYPPIPPEIISPAQSEKLLKGKLVPSTFKAEFAALHQKPPGKPTIVPVTDPRPPIPLNPTQGLSIIEDPKDMI